MLYFSGPNTLAAPDPGLKVTRVVLGRGTQNYTCADSQSTTIPAAAGALAILYDASCLVSKKPSLLHQLPNILVSVSSSLTQTILQRIAGEAVVVGHHYFAPDFSTPVFDFRITTGQTQIFTGVRDQAVPALTSASRGGLADQQFGAVDWLRLKAIPAKTVDYKLAYRVETAGGKAPATCRGRPATFSIEYATEYCEYLPEISCFLRLRR